MVETVAVDMNGSSNADAVERVQVTDVSEYHEDEAHNCGYTMVDAVHSLAPNESPVTVTTWPTPECGIFRESADESIGASKVRDPVELAVPATADTVNTGNISPLPGEGLHNTDVELDHEAVEQSASRRSISPAEDVQSDTAKLRPKIEIDLPLDGGIFCHRVDVSTGLS
jgi:hypothetical protein